jgi:hypothetical protein
VLFVWLIALNGTTTLAAPPGAVTREVPLALKVVFVGIDAASVDTGFLDWQSAGQIVNSILVTDDITGVVFQPHYSFTFASREFKQTFVNYLDTIEIRKNGPNPWFRFPRQDEQNSDYVLWENHNASYVTYDANAVENWLRSNQQGFGGFQEEGWTIVVSYLPELPSLTWADAKTHLYDYSPPAGTSHYYSVSYGDADLGYQLRFRDFMTAWGGHDRLWFVDLSAGPTFWSQWIDLPLQVALGQNDLDISSDSGRTWFTNYLADYIWEAIYNLVAPQFVYYPQLSSKYVIDVHIIDNRTEAERASVPIGRTVNIQSVRTAFQDLVPYSFVETRLRFHNISDLPDLADLVASNYKFTDSWMMGAVFAEPERYGIVDIRPVYRYLLDHMEGFGASSTRTREEMIIPVFAFAFSEQTYFTSTYKWLVGLTGRIDKENGALLGISLPDLAMISLNQWYFTRGDHIEPKQAGRGIGFTQVIIHEVGHSFGLMHPHSFGDIGDFVYSPMGYFTNDYTFGVVDKDALQRAHVDQVYLQAQAALQSIPSGQPKEIEGQVDKANELLQQANSMYASMSYREALEKAVEAEALATTAAEKATGPSSTIITVQLPGAITGGNSVLVVTLAVGIIIAFATGWLLASRRGKS